MTRIGAKDQEALRKALIARDETGLLDGDQVIQDFVQQEPGARIYHSEGDGRVTLLIPERDEYLGLKEVPFAPAKTVAHQVHVAKVLEKDGRPVVLDLPGIGRFYQVVFSPLYDLKAGVKAAAGEGQLEVALQGIGRGGVWSPFGQEEAWFRDDLAALISLSHEGGLVVAPELRSAGWKRVDLPAIDGLRPELRSSYSAHDLGSGAALGVELATGKPVPQAGPDPEAPTSFEPEELKRWPGEFGVPALEKKFTGLRTETDVVILAGEKGGDLRLEREVVVGISSWTIYAPGPRPLLDADARSLELLVAALTPFAPESAEHPLLAFLRSERDQDEGGVFADLLAAAKALSVQKSAREEARQAKNKAAFQGRFKGGVG